MGPERASSVPKKLLPPLPKLVVAKAKKSSKRIIARLTKRASMKKLKAERANNKLKVVIKSFKSTKPAVTKVTSSTKSSVITSGNASTVVTLQVIRVITVITVVENTIVRTINSEQSAYSRLQAVRSK